MATTTAVTATRPVTERGRPTQARTRATQTTVAVVWPDGKAPPWSPREFRGLGTAISGLSTSTDPTTRAKRIAASAAITHRCRRHATSTPSAMVIGSATSGLATSNTVLAAFQNTVTRCEAAQSSTESSNRSHQPSRTDTTSSANTPSNTSHRPQGCRGDSAARRSPLWSGRAGVPAAEDSTEPTERPYPSVQAPVLRPSVLVRCALERAGDDLLGQQPEVDVPHVGVPHQEGECLVSVDGVALHQDAHGGADVRSGVKGLAELLDLLGVLQQGSGLSGEQLSQLHRGPVEGPRRSRIQIQPRLFAVMHELDRELRSHSESSRP